MPIEPAARAVTQEIPEVGREEILRRIGDLSLVLVNVLPLEAWIGGRIPGSLSLPLAEVTSRARQLLPSLGQEVVVYCGGAT